MSFTKAPETWITGWACPSTYETITIPRSSFPELSAAEAETDASTRTADIREVLFSICEALANKWYSNVATSSNPTGMNISRTSSVNSTTNLITRSYTFRFTTQIAAGYSDIYPTAE